MYDKILVALDGSAHSAAGARTALSLAEKCGGALTAVHIYDAGLHSRRLLEMEPFLPSRYRKEGALAQIRSAHSELIPGGFETLSEGYMEQFVKDAGERGIPVRKIHRRGRNYTGILEMITEVDADLVVLGAHGLGNTGDGLLGSTASRVLRFATCDVLLGRGEQQQGKIVAGIDGSREALDALRKAAGWAQAFGEPLVPASVYDPHFHHQVFDAMAAALTPEKQEEMGFTEQKALHEELIDTTLGRLYRGFLDRALAVCTEHEVAPQPVLLKGKAYQALVEYAEQEGAGLLVVGRYGHHRDRVADVGSNSEAVARLAKTNVLLAGSSGRPGPPDAVVWEDEAQDRLDQIPSFVRDMARQGIEDYVRSNGRERVTLEDVKAVSRQLGMATDRRSHHD